MFYVNHYICREKVKIAFKLFHEKTQLSANL